MIHGSTRLFISSKAIVLCPTHCRKAGNTQRSTLHAKPLSDSYFQTRSRGRTHWVEKMLEAIWKMLVRRVNLDWRLSEEIEIHCRDQRTKAPSWLGVYNNGVYAFTHARECIGVFPSLHSNLILPYILLTDFLFCPPCPFTAFPW